MKAWGSLLRKNVSEVHVRIEYVRVRARTYVYV